MTEVEVDRCELKLLGCTRDPYSRRSFASNRMARLSTATSARPFRTCTRAQLYQQVTALCIQRDQIFIEHPGLWAYFYDGRKVPRRETEHARVFAMARIIANLADGMASETIRGDFDQHWNQYFRHTYDNSPSFRDFWEKHGHFWPEETRQRFAKTEGR